MSNITDIETLITDRLFALFKNSYIVTEIYLWGYLIVFLFGIIGNAASLLTFAKSTLRSISTGCLFIALAISDTVYLLVTIIDFVEFGLNIQLYKKIEYNDLCRFRSFTSYVAQLNSAWLLVFISIDRWIRTRFPYKSLSLCTPRNALLVIIINLIIDIGLNSHMLAPFYGQFIPGLVSGACGPLVYSYPAYIRWFYTQWSTAQVFINCLIPVILMLMILIDIIINIGSRRHAAFNPTQRMDRRTKRLQKNIFILLISRVGVFLSTTLPISLYRMIIPRQTTFNAINQTITNTLAILTWISSLNYAASFYLNCLTSKLFRIDFFEQMKFIGGRRRRVTPVMHIQINQHVQVPRY